MGGGIAFDTTECKQPCQLSDFGFHRLFVVPWASSMSVFAVVHDSDHSSNCLVGSRPCVLSSEEQQMDRLERRAYVSVGTAHHNLGGFRAKE